MRLLIDSTEDIFILNGNPVRRWIGRTKDGVPVHAYITAVTPQTDDLALRQQFNDELLPQPIPMKEERQ